MTRAAMERLGWLLAFLGAALVPFTVDSAWVLLTSGLLWSAALLLARAYRDQVSLPGPGDL